MDKRSLAAVVVFALLPTALARASDPGTTAANFLELGIGPRAMAMGEALVGLADDVFANYWNPAGLARLENQEAGFVQTQYVEDISEEYAAYALPHGSLGTFGGSFTYLNVGKFPGYDASGAPIGDVGANDASATLSYARSLYHDRHFGTDLSAGLTGRWLQERLDTVSALL
jgi:hypothetical protein